MTYRRAAFLVAALAAVSSVGCASSGATADDPFREGSPRGGTDFDGEVRLTVQNDNMKDATVYAFWNGSRDRVGMVNGKTTETFSMRWRSEELQLEIDFIAGQSYLSERIGVWDGDHLEFQIQAWR